MIENQSVASEEIELTLMGHKSTFWGDGNVYIMF